MSLFKTLMMAAAVMACTCVSFTTAQGQDFIVDNRNAAAITAFNGLTSGQLTVDGTTLTLSAFGPDLSNPGVIGPEISLLLANSGSRLGIDNQTIDDDMFDTRFNAGLEGLNVSFNETLVLSLDTDVVFDEIDLFGVNPDETVIATIGDSSFTFTNNQNGSSDLVVNPFGVDNVITAGTDISFASPVGGPENGAFGLNSITVTQAVPEPSSIALLGLGGSLLLARRRRV